MAAFPFYHRLLLPLLSILLLASSSLQAQNELVANKEAVKLRRIWTQEGQFARADYYGENLWGGIDLTDDDTADFAIYKGKTNSWLFYRGGNPPDTTPFFIMDSVSSFPPYVGDFWGDARRHMVVVDGYRVEIDDFFYNHDRVRLFEITDSGMGGEATIAVDQGKKDPPIDRFLREVLVIDINNDTVDDVVMSLGGLRRGYRRNEGLDASRQVWIYYGGSEFQLDRPDVVIKDTSQFGRPDLWYVRFAHLDADEYVDMVFGGGYPGVGDMLRFYWGDENSPDSWSQRPPDRDLPLVHGEIGINHIVGMGLYDLDGDGAKDIGSYEYADVSGSRIYLSSQKSVRTRSFHVDSSDLFVSDAAISSAPSGYINDKTKTYEAVGFGAEIRNQVANLEVSGSRYGPDHDYEAWYAPGLDGLPNERISLRSAVADVNGDGYDDQISADYRRGLFVNTGIAIILAGGPYIPFDDTTVSVAEYPVGGESGGLYLWPNPVVDELHIAWRGNLKQKPARFVVYDINGRKVVSGEVDPYLGAAIWRCNDVPSGTYLLVAYDPKGNAVASVGVLKQE